MPLSVKRGGQILGLWNFVIGMTWVSSQELLHKLTEVQNLEKMEAGSLIPPGIWTLADVLQYGRDKRVCPYFAIRRMVLRLHSAAYLDWQLLDALCRCNNIFFPLPAGSQGRGASFEGDVEGFYRRVWWGSQHRYVNVELVIFFMNYYIWADNVCIESLSIDLTRPMLDSAARSVGKLGEKIDEWVDAASSAYDRMTFPWRIKTTDAAKLQDEYAKLVEGLQEDIDDTDGFMANPREIFKTSIIPLFTYFR